ncbi:MAG: class I SAM-dependent methyltransferase [Actinobacteria bacterium]|nr:class I SAM-dependent methyltransferase [Actinomycetota bacterium]
MYAERARRWSGNPNSTLVRYVSDLSPGRALDLGCGEGADAIWLATNGWQVVGVDVSEVALGRAADHGRGVGVADDVRWEQHDLSSTFPDGTFDLVCAHFFQSPVELPAGEILSKAAAAINPGGWLLIVGHAQFPPWARNAHEGRVFPTATEIFESLNLDDADWNARIVQEQEREATGPNGEQAVLLDNVVFVQRNF